jgi:hypothetical protein
MGTEKNDQLGFELARDALHHALDLGGGPSIRSAHSALLSVA